MRSKRVVFTLAISLVLLLTNNIFAQETYVVGNLLWFSQGGFKEEMTELGYVEGENVTYMAVDYSGIDFTVATPAEIFEETNRQLQAMVDSGEVDAFVTNTDSDAINPILFDSGIPIVFARSDDPVATGAVQDLVAPGGNITGIITNRPHERRLQVLTEINPDTDMILYLYSPLTGEASTVLEQVQAVAEELGVEVVTAETPDAATAIEALENTPEGVDWLFMTPYVPFDFGFTAKLIEVSTEYQAGIAGVINAPIQGYVVGYGPDIELSDRQAAQQVDRILRGANPANLPVQTAENYLTINLEAADAINLTISESMLRQAAVIVRPGYFDNLDPFGQPINED